MPDRRRGTEVTVGLFVVSALALLGAGTLWIVGLAPFGAERTEYRVAAPESGGVSRGDRVRIAGVPAGRVERVELRPGEERPVVFHVLLGSGLTLRQGASGRLTSDGLLGSIYLEIDPGPPGAPELPEGAEIRGTGDAGLDEAVARAEEVAAQAVSLVASATALLDELGARTGPLLERMEGVLSPENAQELSRTLTALRQTAEEVAPRVSSIAERLDRVAAAAEESTEDLPALIDQVSGVAADLRSALGPDGARLAGTLDAAREGLVSAGQALDTVGESRGELQQALDDLRSAATALEGLARRLEERPSRLLGLGEPKERRPGDGAGGTGEGGRR